MSLTRDRLFRRATDPLRGDTIATVDEDELRELIEPCRPGKPEPSASTSINPNPIVSGGKGDESAEISVHDIISIRTTPGDTDRSPVSRVGYGSGLHRRRGRRDAAVLAPRLTGNALHLIGIEKGVIARSEWKYGVIDTDTLCGIFTAVRKAGCGGCRYSPTNISPTPTRDRPRPRSRSVRRPRRGYGPRKRVVSISRWRRSTIGWTCATSVT